MIESLKTYVLDILSVILPGAFLLMVLGHTDGVVGLSTDVFLKSEIKWINEAGYVALAYVLGHFVFFIGSFLDNWIFENVRKIFWNDHLLTSRIQKYKEQKTGITQRSALNAFKWSCNWLLANEPALFQVVERHMAESKFFRSLFVVLTIAIICLPNVYDHIWILTIGLIMSLIRYITQRQKSIETAYQSVISVNNELAAIGPVDDLLVELKKDNIYPCDKHESKGSIALVSWGIYLWCTTLKILSVMNLCLNPFRKIKS